MARDHPSDRLRADAKRNREVLIETASHLFAERGLDVPLDEIAKRAGVGSGTLYRHFATRQDLVAAVFLDRTAQTVAAVERAVQDDDAWHGFVTYIRETCRAQAADRGMADLIATGYPNRELRALQSRGYDGFSRLVERTKASGDLRPDFTPEDLILLYMAVAGITRYAGATAPAATERFVALALDGFRADAASPAPPPVSKQTMVRRLRENTRALTQSSLREEG